MIIDDTTFPIVKIDYRDTTQGPGIDTILATIHELLLRHQSFVFIGDGMPEENEQSVDDRRKIALWLKQHQVEVERWIKGHVHIVDSPDQVVEMKNFSIVFKKFWGYPMLIVETMKDAQIEAKKLLT